MDPQMVARLRRAVDDGMTARSRYYAAIDLPDGQQLGGPAPASLIEQLETKFGKPLPPSYRAFLSFHNGWQMVDGMTALLSVEEMLAGAKAAKIKRWQRDVGRDGDATAANGLVIGWSDINPMRLILDPLDVDPDGEWRLVQHYKDEEADYPSFLEWLEESISDYEALADDPEGAGEDSDP